MIRSLGSLTWLWIALAVAMPRGARAAADREPRENADENIDSNEALAKAQDLPAAQAESLVPIRWQFGIALSLTGYQRADFHVEPINSGQSLPGVLERTSYGPSGSSVVLEPGFVVGNQLVLGALIDIGSGSNESTVKDLSFKISQSQASLAIGPRVAYYLMPNSHIRPFGLLAFGYTFTPSKQAGQGLRLTMYQGFAGVGLAYFPLPNFSFDTSLRAAYGIGSGYVDTGVLKNAALSGSIYTLMWTIGTAGWLP
jgi:hypothetical protein